jgi:hypothetical protein
MIRYVTIEESGDISENTAKWSLMAWGLRFSFIKIDVKLKAVGNLCMIITMKKMNCNAISSLTNEEPNETPSTKAWNIKPKVNEVSRMDCNESLIDREANPSALENT